ncbi:MAG: cytochrome c, partial [Deltaproteobacteria bacterium]|nr:cytochrome c [Deltaproteobacteria bacterium]
SQMARHGARINTLQWAALMLNHERTKDIALQISTEPRIARPTAEDDTINAAIPMKFYDLQDELHAAAGELAKASESKKIHEIKRAYGQLTKTCIRCHSVYTRTSERLSPEAQKPEDPLVLKRAKPLPKEARDYLNEQMQAHASAMQKTLNAALRLDYAGLESAVAVMMEGPKIARPTAGPQHPLSLLLPDDFFDLQDDFYSRADALGRAAKQRDDAKIADTFSEVGGACIACHAVYLNLDVGKAKKSK